MLLGFSFRQTMKGTYWRLDAPTVERSIAFAIHLDAGDLRAFAREKTCRAQGRIDVEAIASAQPVEGRVAFRLLDQQRLAYLLRFRGDDGRRYELSGIEEFSRLAPVASLTSLPASLYDESGEELGRALLRFDVRADGATWLKSFRLVWRREGRGVWTKPQAR